MRKRGKGSNELAELGDLGSMNVTGFLSGKFERETRKVHVTD